MIKIGLGWADETIKVPNGGQAPGIVTLTKAFNRVWPTYVVSSILKKASNPRFTESKDNECGGGTVVDRKNGYLSESAGACDGDDMEACVWKRDNGHRLFAIQVSSSCDPDFAVICFYDYDPATQTLTPAKIVISSYYVVGRRRKCYRRKLRMKTKTGFAVIASPVLYCLGATSC